MRNCAREAVIVGRCRKPLVPYVSASCDVNCSADSSDFFSLLVITELHDYADTVIEALNLCQLHETDDIETLQLEWDYIDNSSGLWQEANALCSPWAIQSTVHGLPRL